MLTLKILFRSAGKNSFKSISDAMSGKADQQVFLVLQIHGLSAKYFVNSTAAGIKHARHHLARVYEAVMQYLEGALVSLMDVRSCSILLLKHVRPEMERRWKQAQVKMQEELLVPYIEQESITYDPGFLQELETIRTARCDASFTLGGNKTTNQARQPAEHLFTEKLDGFTNSEILDMMQAYYKSALSVFVNNIAVLAVENCLMRDLAGIFSPTLTADMDEEKLKLIASEAEETQHDRIALKPRLSVLEAGKEVLHGHIGQSSLQNANLL